MAELARVQALLDELRASRDVARTITDIRQPNGMGHAQVWAWLSVKRLQSLLDGIGVLSEKGLTLEARILSRAVTELAIQLGWVAAGHNAARDGREPQFATPDQRSTALEAYSQYQTKVWWDAMNANRPDVPFHPEMIASWNAGLAGATKTKIPKTDVMAQCAPIAAELYVFSYRGDSGATHSIGRILVESALPEYEHPYDLVLHHIVNATMLIMHAVALLLDEPRAKADADRLQAFVHAPTPRTKRSRT